MIDWCIYFFFTRYLLSISDILIFYQIFYFLLEICFKNQTKPPPPSLAHAAPPHSLQPTAPTSQVREHLESIRASLRVLLRVINVNEDVLVTIGNVTDLSYACTLIDSYTTAMQAAISSTPKLVVQLRTVFIKVCVASSLLYLRAYILREFLKMKRHLKNLISNSF